MATGGMEMDRPNNDPGVQHTGIEINAVSIDPDVVTGTEQVGLVEVSEERKVTWSEEVVRRSRHFQALLEAEQSSPSEKEPWRMELIKRARFTIWLDERSVARFRWGFNKTS